MLLDISKKCKNKKVGQPQSSDCRLQLTSCRWQMTRTPLYNQVLSVEPNERLWWSALIANLSQLGMIWEEQLREGWIKSDWPVDMSLEVVLIDVERPSLRVDGATSHFGVLDCIKVKKARWLLSTRAWSWFLSVYNCGCEMICCSKFLSLWLPGNKGLSHGTVS